MRPTDFAVVTAVASGQTAPASQGATIITNLIDLMKPEVMTPGTLVDINRLDLHGNNRAPGSGCHALDGSNRILAILGTSAHCIVMHPFDMAVAMMALDASVEVANLKGEVRSIALDNF